MQSGLIQLTILANIWDYNDPVVSAKDFSSGVGKPLVLHCIL